MNICMKKIILISVLIIVVCGAVLFTRDASDRSQMIVEQYTYTDGIVRLRDATIAVTIADTREQMIQGLSLQKTLPPNSGVWFSFPESAPRGFWMKDMLFPIDIIWLNEHKTIVHIEHEVHPDSFPQTFSPPVPAQFVLEVPAGLSKQNGLLVGDTATLYDYRKVE